jgi:hypothetical protein
MKDFNIKIVHDNDYTIPSKAWSAPRLIVPGHASDSRHCAVGGTKAVKIKGSVEGLCQLSGLIDIEVADLHLSLSRALCKDDFPVSIARVPRKKKKPKIAFGDDPVNLAKIPKIFPIAVAPRDCKKKNPMTARRPDRKLVVEHDVNHLVI